MNLTGRLTRDVELRYLPNKTAVVDASIAVSESQKDSTGAWVDGVSYFDLTVFGSTAEVMGKYLGKGSRVAITGRLKQDVWVDRETQKNRSKVKIVVERLVMLDGKPKDSGAGSDAAAPQEYNRQTRPQDAAAPSHSAPEPAAASDDLPF